MKFTDILGQDAAKSLLQESIRKKQPGHAYILNGEKGCGKKMLAKRYAAALLCAEGTGEPCGACLSCIQAETGNNPDIIYVTHEKPANISVDEIRQQIVSDVSIRPYSNERKIYIVDEAEKMNVQAQNALLKTIEEPPEYACIMLLTNNADGFLQTILSRCVRIDMKPLSPDLMLSTLTKEYGLEYYQAVAMEAYAQGNLGKAIEAISSEDFMDRRRHLMDILKSIQRLDMEGIESALKLLSEDKENIDSTLDLMNIWFRDVLVYKSTEKEDKVIFKNELLAIKDQSKDFTYGRINDIIEELASARAKIRGNVNFELVMELLLLKIRNQQ